MKKVKQQIINDLFNALAEANNAGYENDLDPICSGQDNVYGHISEALRIMAPDMLDDFIETGDRPEDTAAVHTVKTRTVKNDDSYNMLSCDFNNKEAAEDYVKKAIEMDEIGRAHV